MSHKALIYVNHEGLKLRHGLEKISQLEFLRNVPVGVAARKFKSVNITRRE
jgi:hypothetical protein